MKKQHRIAAATLAVATFGMLSGTAFAKGGGSGGGGSETRIKNSAACTGGAIGSTTEIEGEIRMRTGRPTKWEVEVENATPGSVWVIDVALDGVAQPQSSRTADAEGEAEVEGRSAVAIAGLTATATSGAESCAIVVPAAPTGS